jgi:hypothetical protein
MYNVGYVRSSMFGCIYLHAWFLNLFNDIVHFSMDFVGIVTIMSDCFIH